VFVVFLFDIFSRVFFVFFYFFIMDFHWVLFRKWMWDLGIRN